MEPENKHIKQRTKVNNPHWNTFVRFLKDKGCYVNYCRNVTALSKMSVESLTTQIDPRIFVCLAFSWGAAPEGRAFWLKLDTDWLDYCLTNKIKNG